MTDEELIDFAVLIDKGVTLLANDGSEPDEQIERYIAKVEAETGCEVTVQKRFAVYLSIYLPRLLLTFADQDLTLGNFLFNQFEVVMSEDELNALRKVWREQLSGHRAHKAKQGEE